MEKFQLTLLFKIIGLGSASGLVYTDEKLYIISDNSTFLYEYTITDSKLNKIALVENARENIAKKDKPDFESIEKEGNRLRILGSGSTENRNRLFHYSLKYKEVEEVDFSQMYQKLKSDLHITDDQLNIEGMISIDDRVLLFQRGNGSDSKNGIISSTDDGENPVFKFIPFGLPKIKNVETTFTDAVLVGETIYFLATAEDTESTYLDGEVLGSIIGSIDLATMKIGFTQQLPGEHKFEGLALYKKSATEIEFLLCEDNDTDVLESGIYKLVVKL